MVNKKKILIIVGVILAIIIGFIYFTQEDNTGTPDLGDDTEFTQSATPSSTLESAERQEGIIPPTPTESMLPRETEYRPDHLPEAGPTDNPVPPSPRARSNREQGTGQDALEYDLFDPRQSPPGVTAMNAARQMFSYPVREGYSLRRSVIETLEEAGTNRAKDIGFRQWWFGEEHTPEWELAAVTGDQRIVAAAENISEEYIANDIIKYRFNVIPRLVGGGSTTKMQNMRVDIYMKYIEPEGYWLVDAYDIDPSTYPNFR